MHALVRGTESSYSRPFAPAGHSSPTPGHAEPHPGLFPSRGVCVANDPMTQARMPEDLRNGALRAVAAGTLGPVRDSF